MTTSLERTVSLPRNRPATLAVVIFRIVLWICTETLIPRGIGLNFLDSAAFIIAPRSLPDIAPKRSLALADSHAFNFNGFSLESASEKFSPVHEVWTTWNG